MKEKLRVLKIERQRDGIKIMCDFVRTEGHVVGVCNWSNCVGVSCGAGLCVDLCVCICV